MRALRVSGAILLPLLLMAAAALAQNAKTDYDHHANFSQYHTYHWEKIQTTNPQWQSRIQHAVDHALQAKGWQRVQSGGDVAVTAVGSTTDQKIYQMFYNNLGGWRSSGVGESTTQVENVPVGSLVLDLYDTHDKQLIWRGVSSDTLSGDPAQNESKLDHAVEHMLENFPPR